MSSSKLKAVVHTPTFEKEVLESDFDKVQALYQSVFNVFKPYKSLLIVPVWKDSTLSLDMSNRLYVLLFKEALAAAKANNDLNIKLFASSKGQESFMKAAWDALGKEFGIDPRHIKRWSLTGKGSSSSSATLTKLSTESDVVKMSQGSFAVGGMSSSVGSYRLMGVMAEGSAYQHQSTLMVGVPMGRHMIAVGTELGFENKTLNYSMAKLWALMNVSSVFKLSGGISALHEKNSILGLELGRYGAMVELCAHYSEQVSSTLIVNMDAGLRGIYPGAFELGWFGQLSLNSGLFKATAFASSSGLGVIFGVDR